MARLLFAVIVLMALSLSCGGEVEEVRMGTEGAYNPYNFINDAGELVEFEIDLGNELCQRANLKCNWVTDIWANMIPNLQAGQYDTIMAGMSITEEREEVIDFTQPYFRPSPSVYVARADAGDTAVNGKVAAQVATIQYDYLSESGVTPLEYALAEEMIFAVVSGEVDATLVDRGFALDSIVETGGKLAVVGPEVFLDSGTGVGVREDDVELKAKLNDAISSMKEDGTLNDLIEKWFGEDADTF